MVKFYKKYFERIAANHPEILHNPDAKAYFYIKDKYNLKAFDDAIKSAAKTPALLLERYTQDVTANKKNNRFRHIDGRFSILVNTVAGDESTIETAEERAEKIIIGIIKKMEDDFGAGGGSITIDNESQMVFFDLEELPIDPIGPILNKYYGATVGFKWRCPLKATDAMVAWQNNL